MANRLSDSIEELKELMETRKSFPKHRGRPGKRGGSLPKGQGNAVQRPNPPMTTHKPEIVAGFGGSVRAKPDTFYRWVNLTELTHAKQINSLDVTDKPDFYFSQFNSAKYSTRDSWVDQTYLRLKLDPDKLIAAGYRPHTSGFEAEGLWHFGQQYGDADRLVKNFKDAITEVEVHELPGDHTMQDVIGIVEYRLGKKVPVIDLRPHRPNPPTIASAGQLYIVGIHDLLKEKKAPRTSYIDELGRERWAFDPGAYTDEFMERSHETGRLIRYGADLSDGRRVSLDGALRITKPELWKKIESGRLSMRSANFNMKLWEALSEQERSAIVQSVDWKAAIGDAATLSVALKNATNYLKRAKHFLVDTGKMESVSEAESKKVFTLRNLGVDSISQVTQREYLDEMRKQGRLGSELQRKFHIEEYQKAVANKQRTMGEPIDRGDTI